MDDKLKPCPWCGSAPVYCKKFDTWSVMVEWMLVCDSCGATGPGSGTKEGAVNAWNNRASGWIGVKERLPDISGWYVVAYRYNGEPCVGARHYCVIGRVFAGSAVITHWMPNPVSPEAEE